jgi:hypothetical protein
MLDSLAIIICNAISCKDKLRVIERVALGKDGAAAERSMRMSVISMESERVQFLRSCW